MIGELVDGGALQSEWDEGAVFLAEEVGDELCILALGVVDLLRDDVAFPGDA